MFNKFLINLLFVSLFFYPKISDASIYSKIKNIIVGKEESNPVNPGGSSGSKYIGSQLIMSNNVSFNTIDICEKNYINNNLSSLNNSIGAFFEYNLNKSYDKLSFLSIGLNYRNINFNSTNQESIIIINNNVNLDYFGLELFYSRSIVYSLGLKLGASSYFLISDNNSSVMYSDFQFTGTDDYKVAGDGSEGELIQEPSRNSNFALIGLFYDLKWNNLILTPQVFFNYLINSNAVNFQENSFFDMRIGLSYPI